jgi:hypothetical protein
MPRVTQLTLFNGQKMVRLLLPLTAIALIWLLFFSSFSKRLRIALSVLLVAAVLIGLYVDINDKELSARLIKPAQVISCGVSGEFSYRNNYNIKLCLQNTAKRGLIKRMTVEVTALKCAAAECTRISTSEERLNIDIGAGQQIETLKNMSFKGLRVKTDEELTLAWTAEVLEVWATR